MSRKYVPRIVATRLYLDAQPMDAGFSKPPPTRQWSCPCGTENPASRERCRGCRRNRNSKDGDR